MGVGKKKIGRSLSRDGHGKGVNGGLTASRAFMCIFHNKHLAYTLALRPRRTELVHDWKFVAGMGLNGGIAQGVKGMCLGCVPDLPPKVDVSSSRISIFYHGNLSISYFLLASPIPLIFSFT